MVAISDSGLRPLIFYAAGLFAFVLLPFFLLGQYSEAWSARLLQGTESTAAFSTAVVLGLSLDIVLPLPSTIIAATGAAVLGGALGFTAVWLGLSAGCVLGYELGASAGHAVLNRLSGETQRRSVAWLQSYLGIGALIACRPIPVLAEVSVLMAGTAQVSRWRFYPLCFLANAAVAYFYIGITDPLFTALPEPA